LATKITKTPLRGAFFQGRTDNQQRCFATKTRRHEEERFTLELIHVCEHFLDMELQSSSWPSMRLMIRMLVKVSRIHMAIDAADDPDVAESTLDSSADDQDVAESRLDSGGGLFEKALRLVP
jgi:hypothetical protein